MVFHALCVLEQARACARGGAVPRSASLRLALAVLCKAGANRRCIEIVWEQLTAQSEADGEVGSIGRFQMMNAAFNAVARDAGMPLDPPVAAAIRRAVDGE